MKTSLFVILSMGIAIVMAETIQEMDEYDVVDDDDLADFEIADVDDGESDLESAKTYGGDTPHPRPHPPPVPTPDCNCTQEKIAFTSYLSKDLHCLGKHQHIKFDHVILNDGEAYKNHLGVFEAPVSGVYSFTVVIAQRHRHEVRVRLVVNGVNQVDAIAEGMHKFHDVQGTNTLNVHVKKRQHVFVESVSCGGRLEGNSGNYRYTTFSGHLLYERN